MISHGTWLAVPAACTWLPELKFASRSEQSCTSRYISPRLEQCHNRLILVGRSHRTGAFERGLRMGVMCNAAFRRIRGHWTGYWRKWGLQCLGTLGGLIPPPPLPSWTNHSRSSAHL